MSFYNRDQPARERGRRHLAARRVADLFTGPSTEVLDVDPLEGDLRPARERRRPVRGRGQRDRGHRPREPPERMDR
ncbi:MAG: hypothetical protein MZV49_00105 [Rhodopseudomonas palustris]|nr:hypothetical protein [Rhodopseudomonas palustris]